MIFENFKLRAISVIFDAFCTNPKCKTKPSLVEVSNGLLSTAMFCPSCRNVYLLKLVREPKVPKEFLQQCLNEIELGNVQGEATKKFRKEMEDRDDISRFIRLNKTKKKVVKKKK
jgi:hypothetical protein